VSLSKRLSGWVRQNALFILLVACPLYSTCLAGAEASKPHSAGSHSAKGGKNPTRVGSAVAAPEVTLERLSQNYLGSPNPQTEKSLVSFCERSKDGVLSGLACFLLGFSELQRQKFENAEEFLRKAAAHSTPIDDYSHCYWGDVLLRLKRFEEARKALTNYVIKFAESPLKEKALSIYFEASLALNKPQDILESARSWQGESENPELLHYLARAQELSGQKMDALRTYHKIYYRFPLYEKNSAVFQQSSSLVANNPELNIEIPREWRISRIEKLFQRKQSRELLKDLDLLSQADPSIMNGSQFQLWLGISQFGVGQYLDAIETLRRVNSLDIDKTGQAGFYIAESYRKLENYPFFKQSVQSLVEKLPRSAWSEKALFSIGNYNLVKRNLEESTDFYQKLVDLFPSGLHVQDSQWRVSWRFYRLKNYERAYAMFVEHLTRFPTSENRVAALYWAARCKQALGQSREALEIYQALCQRLPQNYYGQLAEKQIASPDHKMDPVPKDDAEFAPIRQAFQNEKTVSPIDPFQLLKTSWRIWPRVKALALIQLFDQAAQELLRPVVYGESAAVYFQAAQLYYRGNNFLPAISNMRKVFPNYQEMPLDSLPRAIWQLFFPMNFSSTIFEEAEKQQVDPYLLLALIRQESGFNPLALSVANAHGLMQLLPSTARSVAKGLKMQPPSATRLHDPVVNIRLGTKYFSDLVREFDGQSERALASYNAGEDRVEAWTNEGDFADGAEFVDTIPFSETRNYVKTIYRNYWFYKALYGGS
jgi:peptidoglycan lytic transglycosylase